MTVFEFLLKTFRAPLALLMLSACGPAAGGSDAVPPPGAPGRLEAAAPGGSFAVLLEKNEAAAALARLALKGPLTLRARDYGGFEKVAELPEPLPADDRKQKAEPGDVMLYQGNKIVFFYGSNEWAYTRLGRIEGAAPDKLKDILKGDEAVVTLSAPAPAPDPGAKSPVVTLNSGYGIPALGLGTYLVRGKTCEESVYDAIRQGYRLFDTAHIYGNEKEVGRAARRAIAEGLVKREDLFVMTKLFPSQFSKPAEAIDEALANLDLGYIDLMLLHHPGRNDAAAYAEIEKYIAAGKIRSAGLSNWFVRDLKEFLPKVKTLPALVQNEIHPYYQQRETVEYLRTLGITPQGWYPFGGRGNRNGVLEDPVLAEIAAAHGKTVAQVILRWNVQRGVVAIPSSVNPEHRAENIAVFDFALTDEEMARIAGLERNLNHNW